MFLPPGSVVLNNWKPLPFEKISDVPRATVGEVLGELTTVVTLRIQLLRPRPTPLQDIKDKLLRLLLVQSRPLLMSTGCPLDEVSNFYVSFRCIYYSLNWHFNSYSSFSTHFFIISVYSIKR